MKIYDEQVAEAVGLDREELVTLGRAGGKIIEYFREDVDSLIAAFALYADAVAGLSEGRPPGRMYAQSDYWRLRDALADLIQTVMEVGPHGLLLAQVHTQVEHALGRTRRPEGGEDTGGGR